MLISPDTSPREPRIPGDADHWDFGYSAGFYLDATQAPWSQNYRMESYVVRELPEIVLAHLPARSGATGIFGHSMGGHGALTLALRNPDVYRSVSAFAPIAAPTQCPWGQKAFQGYLGPDRRQWSEHDATELVARVGDAEGRPAILIDQGLADQFLHQQLRPDLFEAACHKSGYPLTLRRHEGYDHGYYFIATFMEDHLRHHAKILGARR
jgi:S-formylglutathione hydrolase